MKSLNVFIATIISILALPFIFGRILEYLIDHKCSPSIALSWAEGLVVCMGLFIIFLFLSLILQAFGIIDDQSII